MNMFVCVCTHTYILVCACVCVRLYMHVCVCLYDRVSSSIDVRGSRTIREPRHACNTTDARNTAVIMLIPNVCNIGGSGTQNW